MLSKSSKGETDPEAGKIYDALIETTQAAIQGSKIQTVTFIWMQGEADSKSGNSDVYLASLNGLKKQLEQDLERTDINFIIGRLSDSGFYRRRDKKRINNPDWDTVRNLDPSLRAKGFDPLGEAGINAAREWLWDHRHRHYAARAVRYV